MRLKGWANAWNEIFNMLGTPSDKLEEKILIKSDELWSKYQYQYDEEDRVVLWVNIEAQKNKKNVWSGTYFLDERGSGENTAMAKLVSITLSAVLDLLIEGQLKPGVQAAPSDLSLIHI